MVRRLNKTNRITAGCSLVKSFDKRAPASPTRHRTGAHAGYADARMGEPSPQLGESCSTISTIPEKPNCLFMLGGDNLPAKNAKSDTYRRCGRATRRSHPWSSVTAPVRARHDKVIAVNQPRRVGVRHLRCAHSRERMMSRAAKRSDSSRSTLAAFQWDVRSIVA